MPELSGDLAELCRSIGLDISYLGWRGEAVVSDPEAVIALLSALGPGFGFELRGLEDVRRATELVARQRWESAPPVVVAWDGEGELPLPVRASVDGDWELELTFESGRTEVRGGRLFALPASGHVKVDDVTLCRRSIPLTLGGELGYHRARWSALGRSGSCEVLAAPTKAVPRAAGRSWGVFAPLYGLRSERSGAAGDLDTLGALRDWVHRRGGAYVGTLPILAQFLEEPLHVSPYAPASRLFWNELYLALRPPALGAEAVARLRALAVSSAEVRRELAALPQIAYREQYTWKRAWIDEVAAECLTHDATRAEIERWAQTGPVFDYATFRALGEREGRSWHGWSEHRNGAPVATSLDDAARLGADPRRVFAHVVAQWMMHDQLVSARARGEASAGLYLDLPVGVSGDAYEVWRHRELFTLGASVGAPPDALFLGGQEWGLPPIHPQVSRRDGHRYLRACLQHHMRAAQMLRIDHVMGLHRLYCVPRGFRATDGAYLRYPKDELYALVALESHRNQCAVAGEDLGTVPEDVPPALERHNIARLFVSQFTTPSELGDAPGLAPEAVVASFGTHDMATFAGWWHGSDLADRHQLGLIGVEDLARQEVHRAKERKALLAHVDAQDLAPRSLPEVARAMAGAAAELARGAAEVVLITLEDLWLEPAPQNVPGTLHERPNWLRPLDVSATELGVEPAVDDGAIVSAAEPRPVYLSVLDEVARLRAQPPPKA
ncbi:MAG: 4-alpha-glucanotransferase [Kofleriaceae bacterium]